MVMNAIYRSMSCSFQETGDRFIGGNHGIFNHLFRIAAIPFFNAERTAFLIKNHLIFREIKFQSTSVFSVFTEDISTRF